MKDEQKFGFYNLGGVQYCKRCDHIIEFPFAKIGASASGANYLKRFNFRTVERKSWKEEGRICGSSKRYMLTKREDVDSCMNCWNSRGTDCDEPWTDDSCEVLLCHFIAPFTICDLHQIDLRRIRILEDGTVEGIPKYCYNNIWMSIEKVKEWNEGYKKRIREDNIRLAKERKEQRK